MSFHGFANGLFWEWGLKGEHIQYVGKGRENEWRKRSID